MDYQTCGVAEPRRVGPDLKTQDDRRDINMLLILLHRLHVQIMCRYVGINKNESGRVGSSQNSRTLRNMVRISDFS